MRGRIFAQAMRRCSKAARASLRATAAVGAVTRTTAKAFVDFMMPWFAKTGGSIRRTPAKLKQLRQTHDGPRAQDRILRL
jgi:hypothetical protein